MLSQDQAKLDVCPVRCLEVPGTPAYRLVEQPPRLGNLARGNSPVNQRLPGSNRNLTLEAGVLASNDVLFRVWDQLRDNPPALIAYLAAFAVAMVTGLVFHEFCHAWAAYQMGDNTAARQGRLSLNPLRHLDPLGTILLLAIGFGMAKPTPVVPSKLRIGPPWGLAITKAAGPLSNFLVAAIAALPLKAGLIDSVADLDDIGNASGIEIVGLFLVFVIFFNVLLGVFNLLPIPMLDGFAVAISILPTNARHSMEQLERNVGFGALMVLFILPFVLGERFNIIGRILDPIFSWVFPVFVN